jgi:hypothetical protein
MKSSLCEVKLYRIIINKNSGLQTIILKETKGKRTVSIGIGIPEINAIRLEIAKEKPQRPMTHDLLKEIIEALGGQVKRIVIDKLQFSTFYAKIFIRLNSKGIKRIDARPSDSIALALRTNSPIYVAEEVLDKVQKFEIN